MSKLQGRRAGLLGGSFDPVHEGHLSAAESAARSLSLERVILVPASLPPHKPEGTRAAGADRLAMLELAVRDRPLLAVSDVELRRPGPSYTVETVRELGRELGSGVGLCLLVGTDAVRDLPTWREPEEILRRAEPVVLERPGEPPVDWGSLSRELAPEIVERLERAVLPLGRPLDVSSTEIRRRLGSGETVDGLLPRAVIDYIRRRRLYGAGGE
jgi:nicotinate-nucleotide adenylyltransferase